ARMGPFDLVVTSPVIRAVETAIAMGFAVDEQWPEFSPPPDDVLAEADWEGGCAAYARAAPLDGPTAAYLRALGDAFYSLAGRLPDGGRALVVSHGGVVEAAAVACLPDADYAAWTTSADYCAGVLLTFDAGRFV